MAKQATARGSLLSRLTGKEHMGHQNHLCELVSRREMSRVAALAKDARYICHVCGRAAAKAASLCEPVEI